MENNLYKSFKDDEIISLIVNDQKKDLFKILYARYSQKVLDKCFSLLKNRDLAKEFTQEIFAKTYENLPKFRGNSSFSSWLYSISYNYCIDYLRHKKKLHYPEWNNQNEIPEIIEEQEEVISEINFERLMEIIELLHPEEKALLLMKYNDNLSIKHISNALRISESAAKMRIKRAKARLIYLYTKKFNANHK